MKFNFVKNQKIFFAISIVLVVAALVTFFVHDFNLDVEFEGGTELTFKLDKAATGEDEANIEKVVRAVEGSKFNSTKISNTNEIVVRTKLVDEKTDFEALNTQIDTRLTEAFAGAVKVSAAEGTVVYTIPEPEKAEGEESAEEAEAEFNPASDIAAALAEIATVDGVSKTEDGNYEIVYTAVNEVNAIRAAIEKAVNEAYPLAEGSKETTRLIGSSTVSPEVSESLKRTAVMAAVVAVVLMLVYIAIRFKSVSAALAAVVCLAHDIIIMVFAYNVFGIPVSSTIIAAILTILGYSINATIVIFDRIRENVKQMPASVSFEDKVDSGIKSTVWRSINTTITTLLTIGLIYILGVTSIKNFALPLIVGIVSGVYSSVCLSGNIWVAFRKIGKKN